MATSVAFRGNRDTQHNEGVDRIVSGGMRGKKFTAGCHYLLDVSRRILDI